ncbi:fused MFS/spermidine synthase, partial [Patescibacteria group bacterium]|nr:fused MFS/spermidine synthase [Patescibacteria group bacterium]
MTQSKQSTLSDLHWYSFLVVTGATSTAVEITGLRLLAPLFGSSLPIWGSAIAVVIGGLAWGYSIGGRRSQKYVSERLVLGRAALAAGLFVWLPLVFRLALLVRDQFLASGSPLILSALIISLVALLPPSVLFGMVSPLAIQVEAARRQQSAGQVAGRIFNLTTIGSLFGILIPSFLTIPLLGTLETIWLFAGLTLLISLIPLLRSSRQHINIAALVITAGLATFLVNRPDPRLIFADETSYQYITVRENDKGLALMFDAGFGTQSVFTNQPYTDGYWDYLAALPALVPPAQELNILVLGAAASTTERQMQRFWQGTRRFNFTSVEIDGQLPNIADQYFDPPERNIVIADARVFIAADTALHDIIILDTYTRELTVPWHLATTEFFAAMKPRLATTGLLAINLNAASTDTLWIQSLAKTVSSVFPDVRLVSLPNSCNYLLLASRRLVLNEQLPVPLPDIVAPLAATLQTAKVAVTNKG